MITVPLSGPLPLTANGRRPPTERWDARRYSSVKHPRAQGGSGGPMVRPAADPQRLRTRLERGNRDSLLPALKDPRLMALLWYGVTLLPQVRKSPLRRLPEPGGVGRCEEGQEGNIPSQSVHRDTECRRAMGGREPQKPVPITWQWHWPSRKPAPLLPIRRTPPRAPWPLSWTPDRVPETRSKVFP